MLKNQRDDEWRFKNSDQKLKLDQYVNLMLEAKSDLCGVLISGYPGIGKTHFVESYLGKYWKQHPVLIARHRQQHSEIPYLGLKLCISDFITKKHNELPKKEFHQLAFHLRQYFGDSFPLFLEYIPEISLIIGEDFEVSQKYVPKLENQLFSLFKTFFSFLYQHFNSPIFLFTDDLQWIDTSGTGLLKYLLLELAPEKLIWIASYREYANNAYLYFQLVEQLGFNKKRVETIRLEHFTEHEVKYLIEANLGGRVHPDLAQVCFELCGGNPTYLQVLLASIKNTEYIKKIEGVWHGEVKAISDYYKGKGKEQILFNRLDNMSDETLNMLYTMACMGGYDHRVLLDSWEGKEAILEESIREAREAGFIKEMHDSYAFAERHIGELIYENLPIGQRREVHYKIATLLHLVGLNALSNTQMVLMTTQFNQSLNLVREAGEQGICANLNYLAGQYSLENNAFVQAQYFLKMCADLLKECPWEQVMEKVYFVYMEMAQVEYKLGDYDQAEIHLDYLLEHVTDTFERANVFELKVVINHHRGRYKKAVHILEECLRELNLKIPPDDRLLSQEIRDLQIILENQQKEERSTPRWSEEHIRKQQTILKLLYVGGMSLHHTSDVLMKWAALQIITRSRMDSASGERAIGYVSYGRMLIIDGHIDKGYKFGKQGLAINNLLEDVALRCRVYGVYAFYIQPWKKRFDKSISLLDKGIEAGEKAGDLIGRYILKTHKFNLHILSGQPLQSLDALNFEEIHPETELTYYITTYQINFIKFLRGESTIFSLSSHKPSRLAGKFTLQEENFYRNYVRARYYLLFGYYGLAEKAAHEADMNRKLQEGSPLLPANLMVRFLSITQNWNHYSSKEQGQLKGLAVNILNQFELWSKHAPDNFASPFWLLKAEFQRITEESEGIAENYEKAVQLGGGNLSNEALCCEFFAKYLLGVDERGKAVEYLIYSLEFYKQWGAEAKVEQLRQQYHAVLPEKFHPVTEVNIEMIQHEFSGDLKVESLVNKLMVLILRISGSTRVVIESVMDNGDLSRLGDFSLFSPKYHSDSNNDIPLALILLAHRSQNQMIVNDLISTNDLGDLTPFAHKGVKSMLILPVTIRHNLSLIIYVENSFAENWFTREIISWIRITSNQGSVIIENARIHELTVKLNSDLRQEMEEKERLAGLIEEQKDIHLNALVKAQDNDRKRIARDLHDSLGSLLSTVKLRFNGMQEEIISQSPERASQFEGSIGLLDEAVDELRRIAHNMLPTALTKFGLEAALNTFIESVRLSEHLNADLQVLGLEHRLAEDTEVSVYRICQELVQNVIKHADATVMRLQIIDHGDIINLIVEDNGKGMNKGEIVHGFGFHTIESKVNFLKGTFSIESNPGKGTMILINIPKDEIVAIPD